MMFSRRVAAMVILLATLSGCSNSGEDELRQWMTEQRNQTKPQITPIPEPKAFVPQAYLQEGSVDPFSNQKLTQALRRASTQAMANAALITPELNRRKEPLESFPLDSMVMVGSLNKGGQLVALVKVDNLLYQVRPGNYLGQNYGRVTRITENQITLREIVQDAAGEWIERMSTLELQEGTGK